MGRQKNVTYWKNYNLDSVNIFWPVHLFKYGERRKCINYRIFKNHFKLEKYLIDLPDNLRKILTKFRCRNHRLVCRLNVDATKTSRPMRLCHYCREDIGDEYHYLLICSHFKNERKRYESKFWKRPSTFMLKKLMNDSNPDNIQKISLFIKCILTKFK